MTYTIAQILDETALNEKEVRKALSKGGRTDYMTTEEVTEAEYNSIVKAANSDGGKLTLGEANSIQEQQRAISIVSAISEMTGTALTVAFQADRIAVQQMVNENNQNLQEIVARGNQEFANYLEEQTLAKVQEYQDIIANLQAQRDPSLASDIEKTRNNQGNALKSLEGFLKQSQKAQTESRQALRKSLGIAS